MYSFSIKMNTFFHLNNVLITTQALITILIFLHSLTSLQFFIEQCKFSGLLHFRLGEVLSVFYLIQDGLLFFISVFGVALKVRLNTKKHLSKCENTTWSIILMGTCLLSLLYLPFFVISWMRESKLVERAMGGIYHAMSAYKTEISMKGLMDEAQIKYQCCGITSFKDWFLFNWYSEKSDTDQLPFSCCADRVGLPCLHHDIFSTNSPYNLKIDSKTNHVWNEGCAMKITTAYGNHLRKLRTESLIIFIFILVQLVYDRILQTSDSSFLENGRLTAWILPKPRINISKVRGLKKRVRSSIEMEDRVCGVECD